MPNEPIKTPLDEQRTVNLSEPPRNPRALPGDAPYSGQEPGYQENYDYRASRENRKKPGKNKVVLAGVCLLAFATVVFAYLLHSSGVITLGTAGQKTPTKPSPAVTGTTDAGTYQAEANPFGPGTGPAPDLDQVREEAARNFPTLPGQDRSLEDLTSRERGGFYPPDNNAGREEAILSKEGTSPDSPFLSDENALPEEMREFAEKPTNPTYGEIPGDNTIRDTATKIRPSQDPEFEERRKRLHKEEFNYEPVALKIQHTLTALFPVDQNTPPQKIRLDVPVIHESQTLALTGAEIEEARLLLAEVRNHQKKMQDMQEEGADLLLRWNEIQRKGSPEAILLPDSPSLIDNQGTEDITGQSSPLTGAR